MRTEPKVFLSYSSSDQESADLLFQQIRQSAASVFLDRVNMRQGEHILSAMRAQVAAADFLILLLSPEALESPWVKHDLEYAISTELRQRSVTVVPFKVKPCRTPVYLEAWTVIDATYDFQKAAIRLSDLLRAAPLVQIEQLDPATFEKLVGDLLRAYGFKSVKEALGSQDIGFDFSAQSFSKDPFGRPDTVDWLIEVKAARQKTDVSTLRAFLDALSLRRERGLFFTASQLTSPARDWLKHVEQSGGPRISIMEGADVKRLVMSKPRLVEKYFGDKGTE